MIGCTCEVCQSTDSKDKRLRSSGILQSDHTTLVFDTGPDFRQQMLRESVRVLDGVVFTHQHKDHVAGMDDVRAYNFLLKRDMPIFANKATLDHLHKEYYYIFENAEYPGIPRLEVNEIDEEPFLVGDIKLTPIPVMHGELPVLGFRANDFAYVTDANFISPKSKSLLQNLDILVLNALRIKLHHSHFNLEQAIEMVEELAPKQAYFTHISHLLGKHEPTNKILPESVHLAWDGLALEW